MSARAAHYKAAAIGGHTRPKAVINASDDTLRGRMSPVEALD
jgi:hypothetical protein